MIALALQAREIRGRKARRVEVPANELHGLLPDKPERPFVEPGPTRRAKAAPIERDGLDRPDAGPAELGDIVGRQAEVLRMVVHQGQGTGGGQRYRVELTRDVHVARHAVMVKIGARHSASRDNMTATHADTRSIRARCAGGLEES